MSSYILDASVAAGWLLTDEPLIDRAVLVRDAYTRAALTLAAPDLLFAEVANVLWKAIRRGRISPQSAREGAEALLELQLPTVPSSSLIVDALSFANITGRTAYDSVYIALAMQTRTPLLTANLRLVNAIGDHSRVLWLGDFSLPQ